MTPTITAVDTVKYSGRRASRLFRYVFSLWHFSGDPEQVTTNFLDEFEETVNAMPVASDREEGYTVINVHPWSIQVKDIDYVVSKLGEESAIIILPFRRTEPKVLPKFATNTA